MKVGVRKISVVCEVIIISKVNNPRTVAGSE